jgi:hypothetical protein
MPKREIDLPYRVVNLTILDEHGKLDEALEPAMSDELLLKLYRAMKMGRLLDERMFAASGPDRDVSADQGTGGLATGRNRGNPRVGLDGAFVSRNRG